MPTVEVNAPAGPRAHWLGVLGGMGPLATTDFMDKVTRHTPAKCDQDHIPMLVVSDPGVPDRTEAIRAGGADPLPQLLEGARLLHAAGVGLAVMPCNTAHRWFSQLEAMVPMRWLHIADGAAIAIEAIPPGARRIGLLATSGTVEAGVYQERLTRLGVEWILPCGADQLALVDGCMRAVKGGDIGEGTARLLEAERSLKRGGATHVLLGCTEFPVALDGVAPIDGLARIDATDALAHRCVALLARR